MNREPATAGISGAINQEPFITRARTGCSGRLILNLQACLRALKVSDGGCSDNSLDILFVCGSLLISEVGCGQGER